MNKLKPHLECLGENSLKLGVKILSLSKTKNCFKRLIFMDVTIFLSAHLDDEEISFIVSMISEFNSFGDSILLFISESACKQLDAILKSLMESGFFKKMIRTNNLKIFVNFDDYITVGVKKTLSSEIYNLKDISFIENITFNRKYSKISSDLSGRHLKF